jgi:hypothetical protein
MWRAAVPVTPGTTSSARANKPSLRSAAGDRQAADRSMTTAAAGNPTAMVMTPFASSSLSASLSLVRA